MGKYFESVRSIAISTMVALLCIAYSPTYAGTDPLASTAELTPEQKAQLAEIRKKRGAAIEEYVAAIDEYDAARDRLLSLWTQRAQESITAYWIWPADADKMPACAATISLSHTGMVVSIEFKSPCATRELQNSIEAAILKASPFPPTDLLVGKRVVLNFQARDEG